MQDADFQKLSESIRKKLARGRRDNLRKFAYGESDWTLSMESTVQSLGDMISDLENAQTQFIQ